MPPPQIMQKKIFFLILLSVHIRINQNVWLHVDAKRCDTKLACFYINVKKFGVNNMFLKCCLCSTRLHLFHQTHSKNTVKLLKITFIVIYRDILFIMNTIYCEIYAVNLIYIEIFSKYMLSSSYYISY